MIDIDLLRKNPETFVRGSKNKNINIDIDEVLELDKRWRDVLRETEDMRAKQNFFGEGVSSEKSEARKREMIEELKNIKDQIKGNILSHDGELIFFTIGNFDDKDLYLEEFQVNGHKRKIR